MIPLIYTRNQSTLRVDHQVHHSIKLESLARRFQRWQVVLESADIFRTYAILHKPILASQSRPRFNNSQLKVRMRIPPETEMLS